MNGGSKLFEVFDVKILLPTCIQPLGFRKWEPGSRFCNNKLRYFKVITIHYINIKYSFKQS